MRPRRSPRTHRSPRPLTAEVLEPRQLLAGITLITHGYNSDVDSWVTAAANAIAARPDLAIDPLVYRVEVTDPGHDEGPLEVVNTSFSGALPTAADTVDPEIFLLLNWTDVAGAPLFGHVRSTYDVAAAVADRLLTPGFLSGLTTPVAELPMHLLGHSRGGSLVGELAHQLGLHGVWVEQVTTWDPHPVDGIKEPSLLNFDFGDAPMVRYENVGFWDNYWRTDGDSSLDFTGEPVAQTANLQLSEAVLSNGGYGNEHSDTHLWYHGTIDLSEAPPANDGTEDVPNQWFGAPHPERYDSGYLYSRLVGGTRPAAGLSDQLGGAASGADVDWSAAAWPNLLELRLAGASSTFSLGQTVPVTYYHQDADSGATVSFFFDEDQNPYNNNQQYVGQQAVAQSTALMSRTATIPTSSASEGEVYVLARIADSGGRTRYVYANQSIRLIQADSLAVYDNASGQWNVGVSDTTQFHGSTWASIPPAALWADFLEGDFNGDGFHDIVRWNTTSGALRVLVSNGSDGFTDEVWGTINPHSPWATFLVGDFDNDGDDDIFRVNATGGGIRVLKSTGSAFVDEVWGSVNPNAPFLGYEVGDFNGDGRDDVLRRNSVGGGMRVLRSSGTGFIDELWGSYNPNSPWADWLIGDFDGDGDDDVFRWNTVGGGIRVMLSNGSTGLVDQLWGSLNPNSAWTEFRVGDFDGDGADDVLRRNDGSGGLRVLQQTGGQGGFQDAVWGSVHPHIAWQAYRVGDYNGDGRDDLARLHPSTQAVRVLESGLPGVAVDKLYWVLDTLTLPHAVLSGRFA